MVCVWRGSSGDHCQQIPFAFGVVQAGIIADTYHLRLAWFKRGSLPTHTICVWRGSSGDHCQHIPFAFGVARALHGRGSCSTECATFPSDGFHLQKIHLPKSEQCSRPVHNTCADGNTLITTAGTLRCVCGGGGSVCLSVTCIVCVLSLLVCACMRVCARAFVFRMRTNLLQERDRDRQNQRGGGGGQNERDRERGAKSEGQRQRDRDRETDSDTHTDRDRRIFHNQKLGGDVFRSVLTKKIHRSPSGCDKRAGWMMGVGWGTKSLTIGAVPTPYPHPSRRSPEGSKSVCDLLLILTLS